MQDSPERLGFEPRLNAEDWRAFWSADGAWGLYEQQMRDGCGTAKLAVAYGALPIERLVLGTFPAVSAERHGLPGLSVCATVGGRAVAARAEGAGGKLAVRLPVGTRIEAGQEVVVEVT